jgi:hypothetical protein
MSLTRTSYDSCSYKKKLSENRGSFDYVMYSGMFQNSSKCRIEKGLVGGNDVSYSGNLVDLESELRGQNALISHCMDYSFDERRYPKNHLPTCKIANYETPRFPKPTYNQTCIHK